MDFYERVKELQISQQDKSRLKAARLQAMWSRICEDEQKSLARNEELIKEFERVEGHMKRLSARTERLRRSGDEYMKFITEHYPQWMGSKQAKSHEVQISKTTPLSVAKFDEPEAEPIHIQSAPSTSFTNTPYQHLSTPITPSETRQDVPTIFEPVEVPTSVALAASIPDIVLPEPTDEVVPEIQFADNARREAMMSMGTKEPSPPPIPDEELEIENEYEVVMPKEIGVRAPSPRITGRPSGLNSPTIRRLAVRDGGEEVLIPTLQLGSTDGTGVTVGTGTLSDQMSELLGSVQSSIRTPRVQGSLQGSLELADTGAEPEEDQQEVIQSTPEPAEATITLDGICYLLKNVAEDFSVTFNPEPFYRCSPPDAATRKKLVYNANSGQRLDQFDPEAMSVVILQELPLVCQELPGDCMVRDDVLEDISFMVKEIVFRAKLTTDGRQLWDALFDHMRQAIAHNVLSPREMALMIGPALLQRKSRNQEKIVTVLTSLLQNFDDSQMSDISSSIATSIANSPRKSVAKSPSKTPEVKASNSIATVSPRDKSTSDDDFFDSSTPRYKPDVNLTGSAAYRSMMDSGRLQARALDDGDDEVEDILAIGPSAVVVPTAVTPRGEGDSGTTGAPSPVSTVDKQADVAAPATGILVASGSIPGGTGTMGASGSIPGGTGTMGASGSIQGSNTGSLGLKSSGSSQAPSQSGDSQPPNVLQRLLSENEFSDSEISIPMVGTSANKSETDDFDGFFD